MDIKKLKVVELFAGVGGFRIGLEQTKKYEVVWSNQWEPTTKTQHASLIYQNIFKTDDTNHSSEDIFKVDVNSIPNHDVLVGGFPCQDYSVATTLKNSKGLLGKKGVLWWSIFKILEVKKRKPKYLIFENVDRLLKSPASQRGRDFAIILQSLNQLGYLVEWRVVNPADYGMPQKRHRVFFIGIHKSSKLYKKYKNSEKIGLMESNGIFAKAFPIKPIDQLFLNDFELKGDLDEITKTFNSTSQNSPFENCGLMIEGVVYTHKVYPKYSGQRKTLGDILQNFEEIDKEFLIPQKELKDWKYHKSAKKIERIDKNGFAYTYAEGNTSFPDKQDSPSRTIITGEGGKAPSRFKHVVIQNKQYRRLTPVELERLNMFPDNHTQHDLVSNSRRAFLMGNALVVGVVKKIGKELFNQIAKI